MSFARAGLAAPCGILGPDGFNRARDQMRSRAHFPNNQLSEHDDGKTTCSQDQTWPDHRDNLG